MIGTYLAIAVGVIFILGLVGLAVIFGKDAQDPVTRGVTDFFKSKEFDIMMRSMTIATTHKILLTDEEIIAKTIKLQGLTREEYTKRTVARIRKYMSDLTDLELLAAIAEQHKKMGLKTYGI